MGLERDKNPAVLPTRPAHHSMRAIPGLPHLRLPEAPPVARHAHHPWSRAAYRLQRPRPQVSPLPCPSFHKFTLAPV